MQEDDMDDEVDDTQPVEDVDGYDERLHGGYKRQIEDLLLSTWQDLYEYHVDGKESIDGFIVPSGAILATGEKNRYQGILKLGTGDIEVVPNTMSDAIFDAFIKACKSSGIPMQVEVEDNINKVVPFKYNPMLQRMIVTGQINPEEYKKGWARYSEALRPFIDRTAKELAIIRAETGTDTEIYKALWLHHKFSGSKL